MYELRSAQIAVISTASQFPHQQFCVCMCVCLFIHRLADSVSSVDGSQQHDSARLLREAVDFSGAQHEATVITHQAKRGRPVNVGANHLFNICS